MDYLRTLVSGKKQRLKEFNYNLDLTYICPRIIAMSFPGSGLEAAYRNNIDTVVYYLRRADRGFRE
jgi:phosphatidylinositol-3,4,5-trisphosphate 3-phosphatase/dual-specificity protein phosphatase PTEN